MVQQSGATAVASCRNVLGESSQSELQSYRDGP